MRVWYLKGHYSNPNKIFTSTKVTLRDIKFTMMNSVYVYKLICDKESLLAGKGHMSRTCQGASPTRLTLLPIFLQSNESGARMLS